MIDHPMRNLKVFCLNSKNTFFFTTPHLTSLDPFLPVYSTYGRSPMRNLMVFCLPIYPNIGWSLFTLIAISFFPSSIPYDRLIILDERSILITSLVYYFSVDHNLPSVDHHLPYSPCQFFLHIYPMYGQSYLTNPCVFSVNLLSFFHPIWSVNGRS